MSFSTVEIMKEAQSACHRAKASAISSTGTVDMVLGAANSIKGYFMESGNPRQMRGASQLLTDVFCDILPEKLREEYRDKVAYITGGSQIFAILPAGAGKAFAKTIEQVMEARTVTAQSSSACLENVPVSVLDDDKFGEFEAKYKQLSDMVQDRRMLKYDSREKKTNDLKDLFEEHSAKKVVEEISDACYIDEMYESYDRTSAGNSQFKKQPCRRCRLRDAELKTHTKEGELFFCPSCAQKEIRGDYLMRSQYREKCSDYFNSAKKGNRLRVDNKIRMMSDLEDENGDVALLYADVNNLGGAGLEIKGFVNRYVFFEMVEKVVKEALYHALTEMTMISEVAQDSKKEKKAVFEIIAAGGDDICLLLPGKYALFTATQFVKKFEELWEERTRESAVKDVLESVSHLSLSVGTVVAASTTPLAYMQEVAEQLLKSAKKKSHQLSEGKENPSAELPKWKGCIDILVLRSDGQWGTEVESSRKDILKKDCNPPQKFKESESTSASQSENFVMLTARPFAVDEAELFLETIEDARKLSVGILNNLDLVYKRKSLAEAELYYGYMKSKENYQGAKNKTLLSIDCAAEKFFDARVNQAGEKIDKESGLKGIFLWHDLLELQMQMQARFPSTKEREK